MRNFMKVGMGLQRSIYSTLARTALLNLVKLLRTSSDSGGTSVCSERLTFFGKADFQSEVSNVTPHTHTHSLTTAPLRWANLHDTICSK